MEERLSRNKYLSTGEPSGGATAPRSINKPDKEPPSENGTGGNQKSKVISLKDLKKK
jgi:hypothetical protein